VVKAGPRGFFFLKQKRMPEVREGGRTRTSNTKGPPQHPNCNGRHGFACEGWDEFVFGFGAFGFNWMFLPFFFLRWVSALFFFLSLK